MYQNFFRYSYNPKLYSTLHFLVVFWQNTTRMYVVPVCGCTPEDHRRDVQNTTHTQVQKRDSDDYDSKDDYGSNE